MTAEKVDNCCVCGHDKAIHARIDGGCLYDRGDTTYCACKKFEQGRGRSVDYWSINWYQAWEKAYRDMKARNNA